MVASRIYGRLFTLAIACAIGLTGGLAPETLRGAVVTSIQETAPCFDSGPTITGEGVISGTDGDDVILGSDGDDLIDGGGGNDLICGLDGNDVLLGGDGDDRIDGGAGYDAIDGQDGNDELIGGDGDDLLVGAPGDDLIDGGTGNDVLHGDAGVNILDGGDGSDHVNGGGQLSTCTVFEGDVITVCVEASSGQFVEDSVGSLAIPAVLPTERDAGCLLIRDLVSSLSDDAVEYVCAIEATPEPESGDDLVVDDAGTADDDSTLGNDDSADADSSDEADVDDVVSEDDNIVDDDLTIDDEEDTPANPDV